ncbi:MAG: hypothetical protein WBE92_01345 [Steroidobacteraceae bacterium]
MSTTCSWGARLTSPLFLRWYAATAIQLSADGLIKHGALAPAVRLLFSVLLAAMWLFVVSEAVYAVLKSDELQRLIHLRAIAMACVATAVLALLYSALEHAGIYGATWSDIARPFLLLLLIAYGFMAWKYR